MGAGTHAKPGAGPRAAMAIPEIDGRTRVAAILGRPVAGSRSPAMHNAAFAALGLGWRYVAFDVGAEDFETAFRGAARLGFAGLNITAPHKRAAAELVDRLEGAAPAIRMVNTVLFDQGATVGHSTDGAGFLDAAGDHGIADVAGAAAVVIGAGGAGVSVAAALLEAGARVVLLNRGRQRLDDALAVLRGARSPSTGGVAGEADVRGRALDDPDVGADLAVADLVVNSVPARSGVPAVDLERLPPAAVACDLTYEPGEPPFLAAVRQRGRRGWNGLGMLVHQGARSFTLWTGRQAPIEVMAAAADYRLPGRRPR